MPASVSTGAKNNGQLQNISEKAEIWASILTLSRTKRISKMLYVPRCHSEAAVAESISEITDRLATFPIEEIPSFYRFSLPHFVLPTV